MLWIGVLMLLACAGGLYGAYLVKRERETRAVHLIRSMEQQEAGEAETRPRGLQRFMPSVMMAGYAEKLLWAGRPFGLDAGQFISLKILLAVLLPVLVPLLTLFQLGSMTLTVMVLAGLIGFLGPDVWLSARVSDRARMVAEELPLFADLIATAASAGLSLTEAVRRVAADAPGLVAQEFLRAVQEMAAGKPRMQAWRDLLARLPGDELRSVVNAIMQAEQYGTSVAEILRYQIQQIRTFKGARRKWKIARAV